MDLFQKKLSEMFLKHHYDGNGTLHEKCPNMEFFLVCIFPWPDLVQENTDQKIIPIWTLLTQWESQIFTNWWLQFQKPFTRNKNQKLVTTEIIKLSMPFCSVKSWTINYWILIIITQNWQNSLMLFYQYFTSAYKREHIKGKYIRASNSGFMAKDLRTAIMKMSKLRQKCLKERTNWLLNISVINKKIFVSAFGLKLKGIILNN